jgi:hypothetical protein
VRQAQMRVVPRGYLASSLLGRGFCFAKTRPFRTGFNFLGGVYDVEILHYDADLLSE